MTDINAKAVMNFAMYRFFKIAILLFSAMSVTSCLQVSEYYDETLPSFEELRLFTSANQTKAIAESSSVPTDNAITMFTNFHSEFNSSYSGYNVLKLFGYDSEKGVWRAGALENPVLFEQPQYQFSPFYWPGGDKVFLDYVAISHNCLLTESKVSPQIVNSNRLSVGYDGALPTIMENGDPLPDIELVEMLLDYCNFKDIEILMEGETADEFLVKYEEACTSIGNGDETGAFKDIVNRVCWLRMNYGPELFKYLQDDLLYAYGRNISNEGRSINAVFDHAKSWIKVIVNNKTDYDLYVTDIVFDDVRMAGNLILDNSKSLFEAYWDLTGPEPATNKKSAHRTGLIPDAFFVPSGCFGPAESVGRWADENGLRGLACEYVRSDVEDGRELALSGRLSGAMFPNQEPGVIDISYLMWPHSEEGFEEKDQTNIQHIEMGQTLRYLKNGLTTENERRVSLNLPRTYWKMGKVYIYVITISDNEITIDPTEEDWDPVIGPTGNPEKQSGGTGRYILENPSWFSTNPVYNTIGAVNAALESGTTAIEINDDPEGTETTVVLPSAVDGKDVFLNITGVSGKELSFVYAEGAQGPANLFIATDAQSLDINCPNTHVEVNGGSYGQIAATTSSTTLSVGRNVTVETLNIRGGNAEIHGTVTNVLRAGNNKVTWYADTPEKLNAGLGKAAAGDDIYITEPGEYINGSVWLPAGCTLEATVPGVVFNYTSPQTSENWIANSGANAKVKNITWNILNNANYQFIHFDDIEGCTFNGRIYPHGTLRFTDCTFNSSGYEYCVTTWASGSTFKGCTFNTQGKAINVYGGGLTSYTFEDCIFKATNIPEGKGKAAIFVKDGTDSDCGDVSVIITRCTANYERPYDQLDLDDYSLSQSVLWNVEKGSRSAECDVKVTLDGKDVYSGDAVVPQS